MKTLWLNLLARAVRGLVGSVVWSAVAQAVADMADSHLSGEERRQAVRADLRRAFADVPNALLNLAIEAAVTQAKSGMA